MSVGTHVRCSFPRSRDFLIIPFFTCLSSQCSSHHSYVSFSDIEYLKNTLTGIDFNPFDHETILRTTKSPSWSKLLQSFLCFFFNLCKYFFLVFVFKKWSFRAKDPDTFYDTMILLCSCSVYMCQTNSALLSAVKKRRHTSGTHSLSPSPSLSLSLSFSPSLPLTPLSQ